MVDEHTPAPRRSAPPSGPRRGRRRNRRGRRLDRPDRPGGHRAALSQDRELHQFGVQHLEDRAVIRRRWQQDDGASTVEWAIWAVPAVVALLAILQAGIWWYDRDVCTEAAQQGMDAARITTGTEAAAQHAASRFLTHTNAPLSDHAVTASRSATTARVQVSGTVMQIIPIPGFVWRISQSSEGAVERFTVPGGS
ncbi:pilus assembly protein [Pseudonocardiaceae bacterium YIM PH 21723]|nr:pilus assembly protein [Pseudonocardiaceae bacterium YIM PH 21723]